MYNKNNLLCHKIANKDTNSIRPCMSMVALYGNRTIATDGFKLLEVSAKGEAHEPVLYPADLIRKSVKLKKGETLDDDTIPVKPWPDNQYINVDMVLDEAFSKQEECTSVILTAEHLEKLLSVMKNINEKGHIVLSIPLKEKHEALTLTAKGKDQSARALLMPVHP